MSGLLDGLKVLVASAEAPASADREAQIVTQFTTPEDMSGALPTTAAPLPPQPAAVDGDATLRQRLIAAESENARLRYAQIQARAEAFVRAQATDLKVMPPEIGHLTALYCLLAQDDETHGPLVLSQGRTTSRVTYLENFLASRQGRKELTEDVFGDTVAHVLTERSRPRRGEDDEPDPERLAELLAHTAVGRRVLRDSAPLAAHK